MVLAPHIKPSFGRIYTAESGKRNYPLDVGTPTSMQRQEGKRKYPLDVGTPASMHESRFGRKWTLDMEFPCRRQEGKRKYPFDYDHDAASLEPLRHQINPISARSHAIPALLISSITVRKMVCSGRTNTPTGITPDRRHWP